MSVIRVLPENLANQIAAGEVVERPASVVKELLENAIDAGASRVDIQVEGSGTRLIRVMDDGCGMDQDDVLLCLERHATSKLTTIEELGRIRSLGFRGEAVPSIASVARLRITSRRATDALGSQADIRFGRLVKVHEMGCQPGTVFEVMELFGNVPARRKFLKSGRTELAHIEEVVRGYALCRPELGVSLSVDGREVLRLPAGGDTPRSRAERLLLRGSGRLIAVGDGSASLSGVASPKGIAVSGFLLPPDAQAAPGLRLFVNGRTVADRMLLHAVAEGLQGFLMKGRRPAGVIFLAVPPESVDVNVHPTKQEVRFHRSAEVHGIVAEVVREAMTGYQAGIRQDLFGGPVRRAEPLEEPDRRYDAPTAQLPPPAAGEPVVSFQAVPVVAPSASAMPVPVPVPVPETEALPIREQVATVSGSSAVVAPSKLALATRVVPSPGPEVEPVRPALRPAIGNPPPAVTPAKEGVGQPKAAPKAEPKEKADCNAATGTTGSVQQPKPLPEPQSCSAERAPQVWPEAPSPPRYLGQVLDTYLLCESQEGLLVIDQHAAHERLLYERLKGQFASRTVARQGLLFPKLLECSLAENDILSRHGARIAGLGVEVEAFGSGSWVVKAIPALLSRCSVEEIMAGIFSRFGEGGANGETRAEEVLADMACKASVRAGQRLAPQEAEALLGEMQQAGVFSHCPHGRPVARLFAPHEMKKWFYRG